MTETLRDARVLVVDDDAGIRLLLSRTLERAGVADIRFASDAASLFDAIGAFDPSLVLMDMHMPDMDGLEVLRRLAEVDPGWGRRRVLLVTGDLDPELDVEARALGALGVMHKPFSITEVIEAVRLHAGER